jgi:hypothetical protein
VSFIVWFGVDEYIYVRPEDLEEVFGDDWLFNDCENYDDLSDYRLCVAYEDLLYDELGNVKWDAEDI